MNVSITAEVTYIVSEAEDLEEALAIFKSRVNGTPLSTNDGAELIAITNLSTDEVDNYDNPITQGDDMSEETVWHLKDGVLTFVDTGEQWDVYHWGDGSSADKLFETFKSFTSEQQLDILEALTLLTEGDNQ